MNNSKLLVSLGIFAFGVAVGSFAAVTVIREAVPLRDHVWAIAISVASAVPILIALTVWYLRVVSACRRVLGTKGGEVISGILTFQMVSTALLILILMSIFYAAIA